MSVGAVGLFGNILLPLVRMIIMMALLLTVVIVFSIMAVL
jgi:hypothetical protein